MPKLRGSKATRHLETLPRTHRPRQPRAVGTFPAILRDAIQEAAAHGEVQLFPDKTTPSAGWLVLEIRKLLRAIIDTNHTLISQAGAVMVLPTDGTVVRVVRRDRNLVNMAFKVIETPAVPTISAEGKEDPLVAIMREQEAAKREFDQEPSESERRRSEELIREAEAYKKEHEAEVRAEASARAASEAQEPQEEKTDV